MSICLIFQGKENKSLYIRVYSTTQGKHQGFGSFLKDIWKSMFILGKFHTDYQYAYKICKNNHDVRHLCQIKYIGKTVEKYERYIFNLFIRNIIKRFTVFKNKISSLFNIFKCNFFRCRGNLPKSS